MTEQLSFMDLPLEILNQINGELSMIDALAFQCATGNYTNMNLKEITDKFLNLSLDGHDSEYRKAHIRKLFLTIKDYNSNLNNIIPLKVRFGYDIKDALIFLETILDLEDSYDLHFIFKEMNHHDSIFLNNFRYVDLVTSLTILKYKEEDNQEQQPQQHQQFELDNLSKLIKLEIVASNTRINLSPLLNSTLTQLKINNYIHDNWLTEQVSLDDLKITISPDKSFSIAVLPPNLTSLEIISEGSNNNVQIVDYNDWPANIKTLKLRECEKFKSTLFNLHQLNYPYTLDSFSFDGHMHIDIIHKLPSTLTKLVLINKFNIHDEIDDSDFKFASELISLTLTNFSLNFSRCKFKFPPKLTEVILKDCHFYIPFDKLFFIDNVVKKINLDNSLFNYDNKILHLNKFGMLKEIRLNHINLDLDSLSLIPKIEKVVIKNHFIGELDDFNFFFNGRTGMCLKTIKLVDCGVSIISTNIILPPKLEVLIIKDNRKKVIHLKIFSNHPNLRILSFTEVYEFIFDDVSTPEVSKITTFKFKVDKSCKQLNEDNIHEFYDNCESIFNRRMVGGVSRINGTKLEYTFNFFDFNE